MRIARDCVEFNLYVPVTCINYRAVAAGERSELNFCQEHSESEQKNKGKPPRSSVTRFRMLELVSGLD